MIHTKISSSYLTIIVCCYNAEATISDALDSLLTQNHKNLFILVIDDGSSDTSSELVQSVVARDSRVRLLHNGVNRGTAYTRMRGITEADTDLVMFFDADDLAEPELISRLLVKMEEDSNILGVGCYARYFNEKVNLGVQRLGPTTKDGFFDLFSKNKMSFMAPVTLFNRKDALEAGGYRLNIMHNQDGIRYEDFSEDLDLWCRMSDLGKQGRYFITIPEPLFWYRKPVDSLSSRNVRLMQLKMRWIKECLRRRRSGEPELTLGDFMASRNGFARINDYRVDTAAQLYKQAGFAYSESRYLRLSIFLILTAFLSPKLIFQKIKTQTITVGG